MVHPQTIVEKIFSAKAKERVYAGAIITADVDACMSNDASMPLTIDYLRRMGIESIAYPERTTLVIDHYVPCPDANVAVLQQSMFDFAVSHGLRLIPGGEGSGHQVFAELGLIHPGALIVGGDSHTTSYGFLNCLGIGMGASDMAMAISTGELWFKVPDTLRVCVTGSPQPGITGKDIALRLLKLLGPGGANYLAVEFAGESLLKLCCDDRWVICNMLAESSAKAAIMPFDEVTEAYCLDHGLTISFAVKPDPGCYYQRSIELDLTDIGFQVALPHDPHNVVNLEDVQGLTMDMALLGTCTNGRFRDFLTAFSLLQEYEGSFHCELLLVPGSRRVYDELITAGIATEFIRRGAMILPPACGPCCGSSPGVPRDGQRVISTANRNFIGRMGNPGAEIYLASPLVVTASALLGYLVDPLDLLSRRS